MKILAFFIVVAAIIVPSIAGWSEVRQNPEKLYELGVNERDFNKAHDFLEKAIKAGLSGKKLDDARKRISSPTIVRLKPNSNEAKEEYFKAIIITQEDLKREFESQPEWAQEMFRTEKGIFKIVEELVKKHMLYQEAKRKGLDKDPAYQKKVADSQGLILISSLLEKEIEDKAKVTDKDVKDFYKKNKADFTEKGGKVIAFEKIKEMITQRMTAQKQKEVFDSYVETLRKAYPQISPSTFTQIDINKELEALPDFSRKAFEGEEGRAKLIEEMIKKEILYQEAKRKGLDKNPAFVKKVADSQKLILISSLLEKEIEDKAKVTDKDVKDFYEKNKADFTEKGGKVIAFEKIKEMLTQRMTAQKQKEVFDSYIENLKKSYVIEINEKAVKAFQKSLVKK